MPALSPSKRPFALLLAAFFGLFFVYPLLNIFRRSLTLDTTTTDTLAALITNPFYRQTIVFTLWQATLSTALTLLLAMPAAYIFATYQFRAKSALRTLITLPFVLPTVVVATAFTALLGDHGLLNSWLQRLFHLSSAPIQISQSLTMILLAHVFYNYSIAVRIISTSWERLPADEPQAAQMLGATPWQAFRHVTLPLLMPAIMAAAALIFIFTFTSFGTVLILGGPQFATLEVEIYRQAVQMAHFSSAAILSMLQMALSLAVLFVYTHFQNKMTRSYAQASHKTSARPIQSPRTRLIVSLNLALMLLLLGSPLAALVLRSVQTKSGYSLLYYRELFINRHNSLFFVPPANAILNSTAIAAATTLLALVIGLAAVIVLGRDPSPSKATRHLDPLLMLPLATSAVTLGYGFIITFNKAPLNLRSSVILLPIAHALIAVPFVIRSVLPVYRAISAELHEAAALLGASPPAIWRVLDWPIIRRAVVVGAIFAFTVSMGEFGATLFVARPQTPTLPVAIFRFLGQPGDLNRGQALAMSTLLMLVVAIGFFLIERFRLGDQGEF